MKRNPKFRKGQMVWLDTSEGLKLVTIHRILSLQRYEIYNDFGIEVVHRGSLYSTQEEYERACKRGYRR